ncbi:hypothetical protein D9M69_554060 [compost metagenome]
MGVDAGVDPVVHGVGGVQLGFQVGVEGQHVPLQVLEQAEQFHAFAGELAQIDVAPTVAASHVVVGVVADAFAQRVLVDADVVVAHVG